MKKAKIEKMRPYQEVGFHAVREAFRYHKRVVYQLPTGGGKTVVFGFVTKAVIEAGIAASKRKLVYIIAHRDNLITQAGEAMDDLGLEYGFIAAGCTRTIDCIQIASAQTLVRRLDKVPRPNLIIIDECHHAAGDNTWTKIVNHFDCHVLGVTATPCRLDGKGLGKKSGGIFDHMILGPTMQELLDMGNLTPLEIYAPKGGSLIDSSDFHISKGDFDQQEVAAAVDKPVIVGNAVDHYLKICPGTRAIAFCPTVKNAENVAEEFNKRGIPAVVITGAHTKQQQKAMIRSLAEGAIKILVSVDVVSEGTDVPVVETIIMMRPTLSLSLYLQQAGRGMRKFPGKTKGFLLDMVGNWTRHGIPEENREWVLDIDQKEVRKKAKKEDDEEAEKKLRQCENCFVVHPAAPVCPKCGFVYETRSRNLASVDGDLHKVDPVKMEELARREANRRAQGNAKTLADLYVLAGKKGHKLSSAEFIYKARQKKRGLPDYISKTERKEAMEEAKRILTALGVTVNEGANASVNA